MPVIEALEALLELVIAYDCEPLDSSVSVDALSEYRPTNADMVCAIVETASTAADAEIMISARLAVNGNGAMAGYTCTLPKPFCVTVVFCAGPKGWKNDSCGMAAPIDIVE